MYYYGDDVILINGKKRVLTENQILIDYAHDIG